VHRSNRLAKYLQQSLGVPVIKPDSFERLTISPEVSPAKFHKNVSDFGVVYGLAVQLLSKAAIKSNLLPRNIARAMAWTRKARNFTIAASILLAVSVLSFGRMIYDRNQYERQEDTRLKIKTVVDEGDKAEKNLNAQKKKDGALDNIIKNEMAYFKYREVVPLLNQKIVACLPNADNNPEQADLYNAFDAGDAATVVSFSRDERKQLFITNISVSYADSLAETDFGGLKKKKQRRRGKDTQPSQGMMPPWMLMMQGRQGMPPGMMPPGAGGAFGDMGRKDQKDKDKKEEKSEGFLVEIEGYSPYKNIEELLDPEYGPDQSEWGFVTRLVNLEKIPESRFELFGKGNTNHFKQVTGEVDLKDGETPIGIGFKKKIERVPPSAETDRKGRSVIDRFNKPNLPRPDMTQWGGNKGRIKVEEVLVDPMTNEEMSKTFDLWTQEDIDNGLAPETVKAGDIKYNLESEPKYIVRDHWFRISAKFKWKDGPQSESKSKVTKKSTSSGKKVRNKVTKPRT